ncbi:hypothetical protein, partial [Litorivivens sp.]|uniref:hypothetical protein n=1 Tax=Litorivivens sp. TaxID=2020868 RepID=UPI0035677707
MNSACHPAANPPKRLRARWIALLVIALPFALLIAIVYEAETSTLQARWLTRFASTLSYKVEPGPTDAVLYPHEGPFDDRLGYIRLPRMIGRLQDGGGMRVEEQAVFSPALLRYAQSGLFPPFREKSRAGLTIIDEQQQALFQYRYPRRGYDDFEQIPNPVTQSLLYIENRYLLKEKHTQANPVVDWGRFLKAAIFKVGDAMNVDTPAAGGSTLATQIEKFRHSEDGLTTSISEKLRQIASASVRVYQQGIDTYPARRQLVLDYLNTVPLAAAPGFGEVNGLGDGLHVWFGADFDRTNDLLMSVDPESEVLEGQGLALRQVMALMIAQRRPTYYLLQNRDDLNQLTDAHLRLLGRKGVIGLELMEDALAQPLVFRNFRMAPAAQVNETNKGANAIRNRLVSQLGIPLYALDRLDLNVFTTLDKDLQQKITAHLRNLRDESVARQNGLVGEYLLRPGQSTELRYSFTLFERSGDRNRVRVQTDNTDIPFDINEGSKLELGSTAKLRVLATYLEVIAELHQRFAGAATEQLMLMRDPGRDALSRWVLEQLIATPELSLSSLLEGALERRYSASPAEGFFTGGGRHTFGNFKPEDNARAPTVREALQDSVNLPFVRMLRDIANYITYLQWNDVDRVLKDDSDTRRKEMLTRFIDREGSVFLWRFWVKYQGKPSQERLDTFLAGIQPTPVRLSVVYRYLFPEGSATDLAAFLSERMPQTDVSDAQVERLYKQYSADAYSLQDQGYLAKVHPLELWLLGYLENNEGATFKTLLDESKEQRQQVYNWLMRTKAKNARDSRVRTMLELEAFTEIHRRWKQLGYPFDQLVPSLASALGSSGDRPAALAELMGIILNDGKRLPTYRVNRLQFAEDTPYEVSLTYVPPTPTQVMRPEVAHALKVALADVVNKGTGRRLQGVFRHIDGTARVSGGKTGTGDNRLVTTSAGVKHKSRALSRTATLVFYIGDNHFGTLTAFVPGSEAKDFKFTSALPAQVLKGLAPILEPYLQKPEFEQAAQAKIEPEQVKPDQVKPEQVEPEQVEPEQVEQERVEQEQVEQEQVEQEQVEQEQVEQEQVEQEQVEQEQVEQEQVE